MKKILFLAFLLLSMKNVHSQLNFDKWEEVELVDDFRDKTGNSVFMVFSKGKFKNSATYDSELIVRMAYYPESGFVLNLFEYGKQPAAFFTSSLGFGKIKIKDESDIVHTLLVGVQKEGNIWITKSASEKMSKLLRKNKNLKFLIKENMISQYGNSEYNFVITSNNFSELILQSVMKF